MSAMIVVCWGVGTPAVNVHAQEMSGPDTDWPLIGCGKARAAARMLEAQRSGPIDQAYLEAMDDTDVLHYALDIEITDLSYSSCTITGTNTITVRSKSASLDEFTFRLHSQYTITSAEVEGTTVSVQAPSTTTRVATLDRTYGMDEEFTLTISYTGTSDGMHGILVGQQPGTGAPVVYTLSEPYYAYTWWPTKDGDVAQPGDNSDKATLDFWVTVPDNLTVASNGLLKGTDTLPDDRKRFRWSSQYPIAPYLVSFAATEYNTWTADYDYPGGSMPVEFFIYPSSDDPGNRAEWEKTIGMLETFRPIFGEYPFIDEKYGIYNFNCGCGMEHQTMTGQGVTGFAEWLTCHELAHQWWGDAVTCKTWNHIWLNEGFATYAVALWKERRPGSSGLPALKSEMAIRKYFGAGTIYVPDAILIMPSAIFNTNTTYNKASWVLHMLRHVLGDDDFFDALAAYRAAYEDSAATTEDFQAICEGFYPGTGLDWFFQQWIYGEFAPAYEWGWDAVEVEGQDYLLVHIDQVQDVSYQRFTMPIDIVVDGTTHVVFNDEDMEHFVIPVSVNPTSVQFDPDEWVLWSDRISTSYVPGPPTIVTTLPAPGELLAFEDAVDTVAVTFHTNVDVQQSHFSLVGASTGPRSFTVALTDGVNPVTLNLSMPLPTDTYTLVVTDGVTGTASDLALDGEVVDPVDPASLPSGDGVAGGNAVIEFTVQSSVACLSGPDCDDSVACTDDTCNLGTHLCEYLPNDSLCDDGQYCNGSEACHPILGCQPGVPVDCDDGVDCTIDACDDVSDSCTNVPQGALCDDTLYCSGVEYCDPTSGCGTVPGSIPDCNDGFDCTTDACNEEQDRCDNEVVYGSCLIDSVCRTEGELNPENVCMRCDWSLSSDSWTTLPDGAPCGAGDPCAGQYVCEEVTCVLRLIADCNDNGIEDACDISAGTTPDGDGDGVPDECELPPIYVDIDAPGPIHDGSTWCNAYQHLQDALAAVQPWTEVRVAEGTHRTDQGANQTPGYIQCRYYLLDGVVIKGGYAGCGEPDSEERNITQHETVLSGDLNDDDGPDWENRNDNSLIVVDGSGANRTAVIDGFTITAGRYYGVFNTVGSPTVRNCTITKAGTDQPGSGMFNNDYSYPTVINCTFRDNRAGAGAGMYNWKYSDPTLVDCTFVNNRTTTGTGGGIYNEFSSPTLINCRFFGNYAAAVFEGGGGLYDNRGSSPTLINCIFTGNSTAGRGGGMFAYNETSPTLINCTFSDNHAAMYGGGLHNYNDATPTLTNCVFWGNTAGGGGTTEAAQIASGFPIINHSCVHGWTGELGGTGNTGADPLLADTDGPDDVVGTEDDNMRLLRASPCIDTGDNAVVTVDTDIAGNTRILDGNSDAVAVVDMGAYEFPINDSRTGIANGETVVLNPGGGSGDLTHDAVVEFTSQSGSDNAFVTVSETRESLHPGAEGFAVFDTTLQVETDLGDGQFFMTVSIPFYQDDLVGEDPLVVDLAWYDESGGQWVLAVAGNTQPSPGYEPSAVGDRFVESGTITPGLTDLGNDVGDYGVFWNTLTLQGFAWANVDHATDFSVGFPTCPAVYGVEGEYPRVNKNRYLSFSPTNAGRATAIRVTLVNLPVPFHVFNGQTMWVGPPQEICENAGQGSGVLPEDCGIAPGLESATFMTATLQHEPYYTYWGTFGTIHVYHELLVPDGNYVVQAIDEACNVGIEGVYSLTLEVDTSIWGDLVRNCTTTPCGPPDGVVGIATDVTAVLDKFKNLPGAPSKARCDLEPSSPDLLINITDVSRALDAFRGFGYPFEPDPAPPPSSSAGSTPGAARAWAAATPSSARS
ncbi:MAG: right-handed parallel beta-helix repeat-containing protein [Phycisphaerales bacterium]|nr:MAG: right-handed parallel beta-helix repeat-containing protein [Phycisphaerales bacterium]